MKKLNLAYLAKTALGIISLATTVAAGAPWRAAQNAQVTSDISITLVEDRGSVKAGQSVTYTLTMTNHGPDDATFVDAAFTIPGSLRGVSMSCDLGISPDGPFCEYSSLPAGSTVVSTLVATPNTDAPIAARVATTAASVLFENTDAFDPNTADNTASVKTKIVGKLPHP